MTVKCTHSAQCELLDNPFTEPILVLVEGKDDSAFFAALIEHTRLDNFQVHSMGGKDGWRRSLAAVFRDDSFRDNVRTVAQIRDADTDPPGAWQSCVDALVSTGATPPPVQSFTSIGEGNPRTGIFIVPSLELNGALEDFILPAVDATRLTCVDGYLACLSTFGFSAAPSPKARIQTYLAGLSEPLRDLKSGIEKGEVDLNHHKFADACTFLSLLAESYVEDSTAIQRIEHNRSPDD